ncbi:hypothetical protein [Kineosporia babensis]|uniref:Uncharacterized protein n=1 Tax=Kineosporia babensis TaxID=499548 RepID=A0A9X1NJN6_9ACTN|nr:hypothetical protein [Kineosporia babensis]MCD5314421.1 hypothetical protein [Kineosporia babensis]
MLSVTRFGIIGLAGVLLAGCSGSDSSAASAASPSSTHLAEVQKIQADITQLLDSAEGLENLEKISGRQDELFAELDAWAVEAGPEGIGAVACQVMPVVLPGLAENTPEDQAMLLGSFWYDAVWASKKADPGEDVSFEDVQLDAQMRTGCPEVRQDVLDATEVTSVDQLWDVTKAHLEATAKKS